MDFFSPSMECSSQNFRIEKRDEKNVIETVSIQHVDKTTITLLPVPQK